MNSTSSTLNELLATPATMTGAANPPAEDGMLGQFDFRKLTADIVRNKWLILATIILFVVGAALLTAVSEPQFSARTTVQIDPQTTNVLNVEDVQQDQEVRNNEQFLQTQVQILKSRSLAEAVAEDLGFLRNNSFLDTMHGTIPSDDLKAAAQLVQRREAVVEVLISNQQISLLPASQIAEIRFTSPSATLSAQVANSYAENYIKESLSRRFNVSAYARDFVQEQLAEAKTRLEESERALNDYSRSTGLITVNGSSETATGKSSTLTSDTLAQVNKALTDANAERIAAEEKWLRASKASIFSLPSVYENSAVSQLLQKRAALRAEYAQGGERWKPDYPEMRSIASELEQIDRELNNIASNIRLSIKDEYLAAQGKEQALLGAKDKLSSQQLGEQDLGVQFGILSREVSTNRALYDGLLQRFKELNASAGLTGNNISIVDKATAPRSPFSPRPLLNLLIGLVIGIVTAMIIVFAKEQLFGRVRTPEDLQKFSKLPLLATIPYVGEEEMDTALRDSKSTISEAYHTLRSALSLSTSHGVPRSLSVTSGQGSEGKSTTSLKVALEFVALGKSVLLVDTDLRRPSLHKRVNVLNKTGLADILSDQASFDECIKQTEKYAKLDVITSGSRPPNPPELLAGASFKAFVDQATERYDLVVLDSPPLLGLADAHVIASSVESTIFVLQSGLWGGPQIRSMLNRFLSFKNNVSGLVLTKFDAQGAGYYDYYEYSYKY